MSTKKRLQEDINDDGGGIEFGDVNDQKGPSPPPPSPSSHNHRRKRGRVIRATDADTETVQAHPKTVKIIKDLISLLLEKGNHFISVMKDLLEPGIFDFYSSNLHSKDIALLEETVFTNAIKDLLHDAKRARLQAFQQYLKSLNPWEKKTLLMIDPDLPATIDRAYDETDLSQHSQIVSIGTFRKLGHDLNYILLELIQDLAPHLFQSDDDENQDTESSPHQIRNGNSPLMSAISKTYIPNQPKHYSPTSLFKTPSDRAKIANTFFA